MHIIIQSNGKCPFEIVYSFKPRTPIDLVLVSTTYRVSESAEIFAQRLHELHNHISEQINSNNLKYKILVDSLMHFQNFKMDDYVMIIIRPERFPLGPHRKLQAHSAGTFDIFIR